MKGRTASFSPNAMTGTRCAPVSIAMRTKPFRRAASCERAYNVHVRAGMGVGASFDLVDGQVLRRSAKNNLATTIQRTVSALTQHNFSTNTIQSTAKGSTISRPPQPRTRARTTSILPGDATSASAAPPGTNSTAEPGPCKALWQALRGCGSGAVLPGHCWGHWHVGCVWV
eukprot:353045-Chlamydomonas_euryale.AAC.10